MELREAVNEALERLLAAGRVKVQENGAWLASLENFQYEVREKGGAVLLHLWSPESTLVRRVAGIATQEPGLLILDVNRFGRTKRDRLEFLSCEREPAQGPLRREQFRARFSEMLARQFPDDKILSLTSAPDLEHSLSGNYVRGTIRAGNHDAAVIAAAAGESSATYDSLLTFGLLWLDHARQGKSRKPIGALRLFFPEGSGSVTAHRLKAISPSTVVELYQYDSSGGRARQMDPQDCGNIRSWLVPRREIEAAITQAREAIDPICRLNPAAITAEAVPGTSEVALLFRGLPFARWEQAGVFFGLGSEKPLTPATQPALERLLHELELHRSPAAASPQNRLYRALPERWLQSLVAADPTRFDPRIDSRFMYAQVPAVSAGDRGIMDLLAITREGRLVVMELKATEDVQLLMQAADYWLRVRQHQEQEDFSRYGYFPGVNISPQPPLLLLVAPALQFHPACDVLARFLRSDMEIYRVGLSEKWRRGLRVVLRQKIRNQEA